MPHDLVKNRRHFQARDPSILISAELSYSFISTAKKTAPVILKSRKKLRDFFKRLGIRCAHSIICNEKYSTGPSGIEKGIFHGNHRYRRKV